MMESLLFEIAFYIGFMIILDVGIDFLGVSDFIYIPIHGRRAVITINLCINGRRQSRGDNCEHHGQQYPQTAQPATEFKHGINLNPL